jgi:uncharacterized protein (DUF488 family)
LEIYSIGFTKKSAREFFALLRAAEIRRLLDVRLNNVSQLAGFTKRDDLAYFLEEICQIEYAHEPLLAPTKELLDAYKKGKCTWSDYERGFMQLMESRRIEDALVPSSFDVRTVLLCSEPTAERCHRRLVIDYLAARWPDVTPVHL